MSRGTICPFLSAGILSAPQAMMAFTPGEKISPTAFSKYLEGTCAIFNKKYKACSLLVLSSATEMEEEQLEIKRQFAEQRTKKEAEIIAEEAEIRAKKEAVIKAKEAEIKAKEEAAIRGKKTAIRAKEEAETRAKEDVERIAKEIAQESVEEKAERKAKEQAKMEWLAKEISGQKDSLKPTFGRKRGK